METKPCIICYKISSSLVSTVLEHGTCNGNDKAALARFLYLFGRHLDDGEGRTGETMWVQFEKLIRADVISSCEECSKIMESFCELYHQMKSIELMVNWKVQTLRNIMQCASRMPSRMDKFRERMALMNTGDILTDEIMDLKECLLTECTRKLNSSFPRLEVRKCDSVSVSEARPPISIKAEILDPFHNMPLGSIGVDDDYLDSMDTSYECEDSVEPKLAPTPSTSETESKITTTEPVPADLCKVKIEHNFHELNHEGADEGADQQGDRLMEMENHGPDRHNLSVSSHMQYVLFPCRFCGQIFNNQSNQLSHENMAHSALSPTPATQPEYKCKFCSELLSSSQHVYKHKKICHVLNPEKRIILYECEICHEKFHSVMARSKHQAAAHNGEKYCCDFCHQTFVIRAYKYVHKQTCPKRPLPNPQ